MTAPDAAHTVVIGRREHVEIDHLQPAQARARMLDAVLDALAHHGVRGFVIKGGAGAASTVGIPPGQRSPALAALDALAGPAVYLQESYPDAVAAQPIRRFTTGADVPSRCPAITVARYWSVAGGALTFGMRYGVRIEFWTETDGLVAAPAPNAAAQFATPEFLTPATITVEGRERPSVALFDRTFLDEIDFPIDVVYTWVDGDDPAWRERMLQARAAADGVEYHPAAQAAHRYRSREELRYSLRSLDSYAPWVRHVYLVTDQQVPAWLDLANPRLTLVDHRDIYREASRLPVFNSSAIITQLHHIDGLAEHYLYLNDDVFFGRDVAPGLFWYSNGIAKVFPSPLTRPFGPAHAGEQPQINITKNIRTVLERDLGRSVSTALRHTPYPQLRSVNYDMEQRFADVLAATAVRRFRHHDDIAPDQLFHYYAQAIGRAVPTTQLEYAYINVAVAEEALHRMRRALAVRDADVLCLNDSPEPASTATPHEEIAAFLDAYFPLASSFELSFATG